MHSHSLCFPLSLWSSSLIPLRSSQMACSSLSMPSWRCPSEQPPCAVCLRTLRALTACDLLSQARGPGGRGRLTQLLPSSWLGSCWGNRSPVLPELFAFCGSRGTEGSGLNSWLSHLAQSLHKTLAPAFLTWALLIKPADRSLLLGLQRPR